MTILKSKAQPKLGHLSLKVKHYQQFLQS